MSATSTDPRPVGAFAYHIAVFLLAASGLMLEVTLTRIYSATIWYHYAFVAVSVALLGWGLGGLVLHVLKGLGLVKGSARTLVGLCLAYAVSIPVSLATIVSLPFTLERLPLYFAASVVPFLVAGAALAMAFDLLRESTSRLYSSDLIGASCGALAVTGALAWLGGEVTMVALSFLPVGAALCFSPRAGGRSAVACLLVALLLGAAVVKRDALRIKDAPEKGLYKHVAEDPKRRHIALTRWNSFSRIDAVEGFPPPYLARLYIDSDAWTNVMIWDGKPENMRAEMDWFRSIPYRLVPESKTLVIGPGGGTDVLLGVAAGSKSVTAVEMNPIMIDFVRHYGPRAGNLYDHEKVNIVLEEGRNFIHRSKEKFDVILLGFVDSWASVSSGGLALSENYLYTTDAFRDYYDHLSDRGMLVMIRWQVDAPRMISNAIAMFGSVQEAGKHVSVLMENVPKADEPTAMIFMLKKTPFTEKDTADLLTLAEKNYRVHVPGRESIEPYGDLFSGKMPLEAYYARSESLIDPVFDDRPFYFACERPNGLPWQLKQLLYYISIPLLVLGALILLGAVRGAERHGAAVSAVAYFACLGMGFIVLELGLLQRLVLLLGHPVFTLAVLLFSLLVSSGIGSWVSGRAVSLRKWMAVSCLLVAVLGVAYALALPSVVRALLPLPIEGRIAAAVALLFPLGFVMGMPFPTGLRAVTPWFRQGPPLFWGLNGVASVAGSIAAVALAMLFGFGAVMGAGSVCYVAAALACLPLWRAAHA
ncbi:MAG: hypothetical protein AAB434_07525 [Planctomycetota bacterium]